MLIQLDGTLHPALLRLARLVGLSVTDETPQAVNDLLQREWVKATEGKFRADLGGRFPTDEELVLLNPLGAASINLDSSISYLGACLLGATLKGVTRRVWFLVDQAIKSGGVRGQFLPPVLYLLGSTRQLDAAKQEMFEDVPGMLAETGASFSAEEVAAFKDCWPLNELVMMEVVVNHWINPSPYSADRVVSILAPDGLKSDGTPRSANTAETVKQFVKSAQPGHYLVVSSQPFCEGQLYAVRRAAQESGIEGFTFDVCGPDAPPLQLSRWLDNIAKQLWEECRLV